MLNDIIKENPDARIRQDWDSVKDNIMMFVVYQKFSQNPHLLEMLISTGNARLVEHTAKDSYWGDGGNGTGLNKLGNTLMKVRDSLSTSSE